MADGMVMTHEGEDKKFDIVFEVVKIAGQLSWFADALERSGNEPGADLIVRGIAEQLDALIDPISGLQGKVHHG